MALALIRLLWDIFQMLVFLAIDGLIFVLSNVHVIFHAIENFFPRLWKAAGYFCSDVFVPGAIRAVDTAAIFTIDNVLPVAYDVYCWVISIAQKLINALAQTGPLVASSVEFTVVRVIIPGYEITCSMCSAIYRGIVYTVDRGVHLFWIIIFAIETIVVDTARLIRDVWSFAMQVGSVIWESTVEPAQRAIIHVNSEYISPAVAVVSATVTPVVKSTLRGIIQAAITSARFVASIYRAFKAVVSSFAGVVAEALIISAERTARFIHAITPAIRTTFHAMKSTAYYLASQLAALTAFFVDLAITVAGGIWDILKLIVDPIWTLANLAVAGIWATILIIHAFVRSHAGDYIDAVVGWSSEMYAAIAPHIVFGAFALYGHLASVMRLLADLAIHIFNKISELAVYIYHTILVPLYYVVIMPMAISLLSLTSSLISSTVTMLSEQSATIADYVVTVAIPQSLEAMRNMWDASTTYFASVLEYSETLLPSDIADTVVAKAATSIADWADEQHHLATGIEPEYDPKRPNQHLNAAARLRRHHVDKLLSKTNSN
ncbi:hypothetical protein GQ42DRAFT_180363 [Ramicandelaber brevisporus]|nr:hypothetical protein GQ42DRAFT_180363 [Ramicandelaber brevisporus]